MEVEVKKLYYSRFMSFYGRFRTSLWISKKYITNIMDASVLIWESKKHIRDKHIQIKRSLVKTGDRFLENEK